MSRKITACHDGEAAELKLRPINIGHYWKGDRIWLMRASKE
jgi:hypothetical protein